MCPAQPGVRCPPASTTQGKSSGGFNSGTGIHGFLDAGGSFTQLDVPGAPGTMAIGINDAGQIVGNFSDTGVFFPSHGFLATTGTVSGDPNFRTYDGLHYDLQVPGIFVLRACPEISESTFDRAQY
jgi:hypothetical protein